MNYILEPEDLTEVFRLVNNYLDPGGVFIFDMNTEYKYREIMGDNTIAEDRDDSSFIWDNQYDEEEQINIYDLSIFVREDGDLFRSTMRHIISGLFPGRGEECHHEAGMEFVAAYDAFTKNPPREDSERIYVIAREHGKERK